MLFTQGQRNRGVKGKNMILTCPACDTKYVVKDGAIPPGGRQVRCASCKHSWHQDPDRVAVAEAVDQSIAEAAMIEPRSGPEAEERAYQESMIEDEAGPVADDAEVAAAPPETAGESEPAAPPERDQWADSDTVTGAEAAAALQPEPASSWLSGAEQADTQEFEPFYEPEPIDAPGRRIPVLVWILLLVAGLAAAGWFLAPDSVRARLGLAGAGASQLEVMVTNSDRQRLASGNELFAVSGRVINPTDHAQAVPPLKAELLDATKKKVVYSWTIAPPAATLAPGASASFNSAEVDVPEGGSHLRVTLEGAAA
jgi:predicted Zn finger-like uncharacterized protein